MLMHPTASRLFEALLTLHKIDGFAEPGKVANAMGESPATITNWKTRGVSKAGQLKAEERFQISPMWIRSGEGKMSATSHGKTDNFQAVTFSNKVPLISWVQAGNLQGVDDVYRPGEAEEWIDVEARTGDHAFALRVVGDSMVSPYPNELSFPEGAVLIVDPARGASAGDFVIAKDIATQQATFKKLAHDGGRWFLKPLNPAYPTVEIDDPALRVIGRVVEFQVRRKL